MSVRFGIGYDAHQLVAGRDLFLAGIKVPYENGLEGHSDGDVATHAIIDALLGAAALGDIGSHFGSGTPSVQEGMSSIELLKRTSRLLTSAGWQVVNVDATICAQRPRIADHTMKMRVVVADAIGIAITQVSIKATTEDSMGYTGSGVGIAALAVASIVEFTP